MPLSSKSLFFVFKIIIVIMIGLTEKGAAKTIVSKSIRNLQTSLLLLIVKMMVKMAMMVIMVKMVM